MSEADDRLKEESRLLEISIASKISNSASITAIKLDELVGEMIRMGMSREEIRNVLLVDLKEGGRLFGEFRNAIKNITGQAITNASATAERFVYEESKVKEFRWVTAGNNVCPDCERRAGRIEARGYWESVGLPRSGFSVCRGNCNCRIVPATYSEDKIEEVKRRAERKKELEAKFRT